MYAAAFCVTLTSVEGAGFGSIERPQPGRSGRVQLIDRATADAGGVFLSIGASYFPAIALERTEPERLDRNLKLLSGHVSYIRIFGDVGGGVWSARKTQADRPDYWPVVGRLFARLNRHHLRAEVTVFAGSPVFTNLVQRTAFLDRWVDFANAHPDQIQGLEISNEELGAGPLSEIQALARRAAARTDLVVSATSPRTQQDVCALYARAGLDAMTLHFARGFGADGWVRPVRQPWGAVGQWDGPDQLCPGAVPPILDNERIGIQASVQADSDPRHQIVGIIVSFISKSSMVVLHSGAGTYAQKNPPGVDGLREANLADQPTFVPTLKGLKAAQSYLPADLPNWRKCNGSQTACSPLAGISGRLAGRCYVAQKPPRFVAACFGADVLALPLTAARSLAADVRDPLDGAIVKRLDLRPGEALNLDRSRDAYVLVGHTR